MNNINTSVEEFLSRFDFVKAKWDGYELTCYDTNGHPFGCRGFIPGSDTRNAWNALEDKLYDEEINEREFRQSTQDEV